MDKINNYLFLNYLRKDKDIIYFGNTEIIFFSIEDDEYDYIEINLGFKNQIFTKDDYLVKIEDFKLFITDIFKTFNECAYALFSYELNGYIVGNVKTISDFDDTIFNKFPIVMINQNNNNEVRINLKAQDIFTFDE
ncbi:MAG: hypothetical protein WCR42_07810 [bacterium]